MAAQESQIESLSTKVVKISRKELPFSCPPRDKNGSDMHPRVYIPLKGDGDEASCPYCRTRYRLEG